MQCVEGVSLGVFVCSILEGKRLGCWRGPPTCLGQTPGQSWIRSCHLITASMYTAVDKALRSWRHWATSALDSAIDCEQSWPLKPKPAWMQRLQTWDPSLTYRCSSGPAHLQVSMEAVGWEGFGGSSGSGPWIPRMFIAANCRCRYNIGSICTRCSFR
jgi:hypothetical protein